MGTLADKQERKRAREREWAKNNPDAIREKNRRYRLKNRDKFRAYTKSFRERHAERLREEAKGDIEKTRAYRAGYHRARRRDSVAAALRHRVSARMRLALKGKCGGKMGASWHVLVGYTVEALKEHLQGKFQEGMTWEDFLAGRIHVDHIVPVTAFNFESTKDIDFTRCFSLSNLQPLWARDNIRKRDKLSAPFQPMLRLEV